MVEKKLLIDEEKIEYEGLFNLIELYSIIDDYLKIKGYDKFEPVNEENVHPDGKSIHVIISAEKWHTDYVKKMVRLELFFSEIKDIETEIDGAKVKLNQGKVRLLFSGSLHTDWEGRWEQRAIYAFIRTIYDKFIYRKHTKDFEMEIIHDVNELKSKMGAYLNLHRFRKAL